jgi:hypothetical protein
VTPGAAVGGSMLAAVWLQPTSSHVLSGLIDVLGNGLNKPQTRHDATSSRIDKLGVTGSRPVPPIENPSSRGVFVFVFSPKCRARGRRAAPFSLRGRRPERAGHLIVMSLSFRTYNGVIGTSATFCRGMSISASRLSSSE